MSHATTFVPGIGRFALDRYDFKNHVDGYNTNHNADDITIIPSIYISDVEQTDVYSAISSISDELTIIGLSGKGFITVGDGYDTYRKSNQEELDYDINAPYDSSVPAFNTYLDNLLNISDPSDPDYNNLHPRIRSGGVVLIKAGTYKFTGSVNVPTGMILMGEGYGTKIVNQMVSPAPLFIIKADSTRVPDSGVDSTLPFIFAKETIFINLTIADNFLEPKFLGDTSYKLPINNDSVYPLISLEEGASLSCENVRIMGKTVYSVGVISDISSFAIKTDSTLPVTSGTRLKILNSSIDGFAVPIQFTASGGAGSGYKDSLIVNNNLIRGYGFLNSDFVTASNNTIIKINACNANINNNYFMGYDSTVSSLIYINNPTIPLLQSLSKVNISNNNIVIKPGDNSVNTTFELVKYNNTVSPNRSDFYVSVIKTGNQFNGVLETNLKVLKITASSPTAYLFLDSNTAEFLLLVDTTSIAPTIFLPPHLAGRKVTVKDIADNASNNNITLARNGSTGNIENYAGSFVMENDSQSAILVSDGTNWWFV